LARHICKRLEDERYGLNLGLPSNQPKKIICDNLRNLQIEKALKAAGSRFYSAGR
jgi:hypothetical protein